MIKLTVAKETMRENIGQPFLLFAAILGLAAMILLSVGLELQYQDNILTGIALFGKMNDDNPYLLLRIFLDSFSGLVFYLLMFLCIIGGSSTHVGMLQNPLTGIVLTKNISRPGMFLSKFVGFWLLVSALVLILATALWFIVWVKSGGNLSPRALLVAVCFSLEFAVIFAFAAFLGVVVENATGVAILSLGVHLYVSPFIANLPESVPAAVLFISSLLPPVGAMSPVTIGVITSGEADFSVFLRGLPHIVVFLAAGAYVFQRKDLR